MKKILSVVLIIVAILNITARTNIIGKKCPKVPKHDKTKLLTIEPIDPPNEKLDIATKIAIKIAMILPTTFNVVAFSF